MIDRKGDAVLIATGDLQHAPILKLVAEAGKDAYCEKPMANDLDEAKAAHDAVLAKNLMVQIGTQHRSEPYQIAVRDLSRMRRAEIQCAISRRLHLARPGRLSAIRNTPSHLCLSLPPGTADAFNLASDFFGAMSR